MLAVATSRPLSRVASGGFLVALLAGLALWLAGTGYRLRWWELQPAFTILRWAAYGGLVAAVLSLLGVILARPGGSRRGFPFALTGLLIGLVVVGTPWQWWRKARRVPPIHDITTDTETPPAFVAILPLRACAPKHALGVSLTRLPAGVRVRLEATDNGGVERLVECRGWQPGHYMGMNARYFLEALACVRRGEVTLAIKDEASPVHITDEDLSVVISPLRVSEPVECQKDKKDGGIPEQANETTKASQAE